LIIFFSKFFFKGIRYLIPECLLTNSSSICARLNFFLTRLNSFIRHSTTALHLVRLIVKIIPCFLLVVSLLMISAITHFNFTALRCYCFSACKLIIKRISLCFIFIVLLVVLFLSEKLLNQLNIVRLV
jgi:hypothetical protein